MGKKVIILLLVLVPLGVISVLSFSYSTLTEGEPQLSYINNPIYCQKDSDCVRQYSAVSCVCGCPDIVNEYHYQEFDCTKLEEGKLISMPCTDRYCGGSIPKCVNSECISAIE